MTKLKSLFFSILLFLSVSISAQLDSLSRGLNQHELDSIRQLKDYDYNRVIEEQESPILESLGMALIMFFNFLFSTKGVILLCFLLLIIVIIALRRRLSRRKIKVKPTAKEFPISINIDNSFQELKTQLQNSIQVKDYKLSIRFQFNIIIKLLENKKLIQFHIEKTNRNYLIELPKEYKEDFELAAKIFDYIWYGNLLADEELFSFLEKFAIKLEGGGHVA